MYTQNAVTALLCQVLRFFFYMVLRNFRNDVVISDITEESPNVAA